MSRLGDLIVIVGANIDGFKVAMKDAVDQIDYFADDIEKRFKSIEGVGKRLAEVGAGITAAVTVPIVGLGTAAITTAAQFETTQIAFTTLMGSAGAANEALAGLYKFAAETPFQVQGVLQGTRTLLAMQFAAKDVIPILRTLGDAASGLGLGQEGLERLVFHFGQIKALGAIDGRVIREMGQAGINAGQMLADALGKTVPEVMDLVHKKAIGSTVAINALLKGMGENFGGLMQKQSESLSGLWSNLQDNVTLSLVEIGKVLLPVGKQVVQFLMDATAHVKALAQWFADLPGPVQAAVGAFAGIVALAGPLMLFVGGLALALPPLIALIGATTVALGTTTVALAGATAGLSLLLPLLIGFGVWIEQHQAGVAAFVKSLAQTGVSASGIAQAVVAYQLVGETAAVAAKQTDAVSEAMKTLRLNVAQTTAALSDPKAAWAENHARAVQEARAAVDVLVAANQRGAVSADVMAAAQKRLATVLAQKAPNFTEAGPKESTKLSDRARAEAKEIDGELAHSKALFAIEADRIKFRHDIGQIGDAEYLDALNKLQVTEDDAERKALERKKAIYKNNLTERQSLDNQMEQLADKAALHMQQASEKVQVSEGAAWEKYIKGIQKTFAETTKEIAHTEADLLKTAEEVAVQMAKLSKIGAENQAEGKQHAIAMERLADERAYGLQIGKTAASEIAHAQQMLELDRQESAANIKKLEQERDAERDVVKRGEIENRLATARNQADEKQYASLTRIKQLQQQSNVLAQAQAVLWNAFNNSFQKLSQGIASAIVQAKGFGAAMKSVLQDIGTEILQGLIGVAFGALREAMSAAVLKLLGIKTAGVALTDAQIAGVVAVKAASSAADIAAVFGMAAVGGAAATASIAAIPIIGPALAPEAGIAMYAYISGLYAPLAAFEKGGLVPETMLALVHKGEWVTPAAQVAQGITGPRSGSGGNTYVTINTHSIAETSRALMKYAKQAGGPMFSPAS